MPDKHYLKNLIKEEFSKDQYIRFAEKLFALGWRRENLWEFFREVKGEFSEVLRNNIENAMRDVDKRY